MRPTLSASRVRTHASLPEAPRARTGTSDVPIQFETFQYGRDYFLGGTMDLLSPPVAAIVGAIGVLVLKWLFLYHLYRTKTFLRV